MDTAFSDRTALRAARILASFFVLTGVVQLSFVLYACVSVPISDGWAKLIASPIAFSALLDYVIGSIFAATYLWVHNGPPLLGIPARVVAVIFPFTGNFLLLFYLAAMLISAPSITAALLPATATVAATSPPPVKRGPTTFVLYLFSTLLFIFVAYCSWALSVQRFKDGAHDVFTDIWSLTTFIDNLSGLVFTMTLLLCRERRLSLSLAAWVTAFLLFGNGATCVYAMLVARQALNDDVALHIALLSVRNPYW